MFPIEAAIGVAGKVIDKIFPDPTQKQEALNKLEELKLQGQLDFLKADLQIADNQTKMNLEDAASQDPFRTRWRPAIGWICALAFGWNFILLPFMLFWAQLFGAEVALKEADLSTLSPILFTLLGFGGLRSFEKVRGVK